MLAEWDYAKNMLAPTDFAPKSNVRAHWKCRFGHEWEATVVNRTHNMSGCPFCTNQTSRLEMFILCELRAIYENVDWRKKFDGVECDIYVPELSIGVEVDGEYWHKAKLVADTQKTQFFEQLGITVFRVRDVRIPLVPGICIQFSVSQKPIDICLALFTNISERYPSETLGGYLSSGVQRNERDFREMIARLPAPPEGESLADMFPAVSEQWDYQENVPLTPELFSPGADQKVAWVCLRGHKWRATIKNRTARGSGCPKCYREQSSGASTRRLAEKVGTLEAAAPPFLAMWDHDRNRTFKPSELAVTSAHRLWWKCQNGHSFLRSPAHMGKNSTCPKCRSLAVQYPDIASQWDQERNGEATPSKFLPSSSVKVWWRCEKGHHWRTQVSQRTAGSGCPQCFEERRSKMPEVALARREGKTLAEMNPACLSEWDSVLNADASPDTVHLGGKQKYWWRCAAGHSYKQTAISKLRGYKCPFCTKIDAAESTRKAKLAKSGSLADNFPALAAEWHPSKNGELRPTDVGSNSHKRVWWLCARGHAWEQTPNYRVTLTRRGSSFGCPRCGRRELKQGRSRKSSGDSINNSR
jgi:Zn finger protein HypA/HybF involved in hydrogenase expression